jgi:eukaryotic-like serine/threonine-protein kinase
MPDWNIVRRLGSGAFGEVWLVVDRALGAERAVKLVRPDRLHDPSNFYAEPRTLVALRHAHIVEVHDAGTLDDGRIYIAMEYVQEGSLEDQFQGSVVPVKDALTMVADACRGIEFAHTHGFIHRDVKPANLLRTGTGTKVSDFGLATRTVGIGVASPYGYVSHCAPEVLDPGVTSPLTDVYALGMTLYRLLNGDSFLPDPAQLGVSLDEAIMSGTFPNRSRFRDHVPRTIRRVVQRAIAYESAKRTQSAAELRHDIERVIPEVSFVEIASRQIATWHGSSRTHEWQASIVKDGGRHCFDIRRGRIGGRQRRLREACAEFATEGAARKHARDVLNRLGRPL